MCVTSAQMLLSRDAQSSDLSNTECNTDTKGRLVVGCWSQGSPGHEHFKYDFKNKKIVFIKFLKLLFHAFLIASF